MVKSEYDNLELLRAAEQSATPKFLMTNRSTHAEKYTRYRFLFEELVKRDFKKKYKRTVLGML